MSNEIEVVDGLTIDEHTRRAMESVTPSTMPQIVPLQKQLQDNADLVKALAPQIQKHHMLDNGRERYVRAAGGMAVAETKGYTISVSKAVRVKASESGEPVDHYEATAWLMRGKEKVAHADGTLGMDEQRWVDAELYARRSMCQTRAVAKLCRINFGALYVLLGATSDTPAEEMEPIHYRQDYKSSTPAKPVKAKKSTKKSAKASEVVEVETGDPSSYEENVTEKPGGGVGVFDVVKIGPKLNGRTGEPVVSKKGTPCIRIETGQGWNFDTFFPPIVRDAKAALAEGSQVEIVYKTNTYGGDHDCDVDELAVLTASTPAAQAPVSGEVIEEVDLPF